jgi:hypothetical protein
MARRQQFANHRCGYRCVVTIWKIVLMHRHRVLWGTEWGEDVMAVNGQAVLENVRRYRTIASLCRQAAAFRPHQRGSLLEQAHAWEERAVAELEGYFSASNAAADAAAQRSVHARARLGMFATA